MMQVAGLSWAKHFWAMRPVILHCSLTPRETGWPFIPDFNGRLVNSKHYNINQLRIDLWNELKEKTHKEHVEEIGVLLQTLLSIECYFAFPGTSVVSRFMIALSKGELKALSNQVAEIVHLLVSDNYRRHPKNF